MRTYKANLSKSSFMQLAKDLNAYADTLETKCKRFVALLAEKGVLVAKTTATGKYGSYVLFQYKVEPQKDGCTAIMYGTNTGLVTETWMINSAGDTKSVDVSPILMLEFGSGFKAVNPYGLSGVGQGTFPEQTHAFDPKGWSYRTVDGEWHHSTGYQPSSPMYTAAMAMYVAIATTAKQVFGE